jgi:isomerase DpgB
MVTHVLDIDGTQPLTILSVKALDALCDKAEDHVGPGIVLLRVSGAPDGSWTRDLTVALVNKWERTLRRFERLPMTTVAVASGDCGGMALDALLTTDYRLVAADVRLLVPVDDGATWPGMALYRLTHQAGAARIRRAALFGAAIDAGEALAAHLVDELAEDPESALAEVTASIGGFSGPELAIRRQLVFDAASTAFEDVLGSHLAACDRTLRRALAEEEAAR